MTARAFSFDYDLMMQPAGRDAVCAWLRANGVDPGNVPVTAVVQVDAATVTVRGYRSGGDAPGMLVVPLCAPLPDLAALRPLGGKPDLRVWLEAEYAKAQAAARDARVANEDLRRREGPKAVGCFHVSAMARMCAIGEVLKRLDNPDLIPEGDVR